MEKKMNDWKKIFLDTENMWPKETHIVLEEPHKDDRGSIQSLVNFPIKNVSLITSVKGSVRSNHYHKTNWHYMYMISGTADYYFRSAGSNKKPTVKRWKTGELIFTPPLEEHTTVFLEDSIFLVISRNSRDQESYEKDVVRVQLIDPNTIKNGNINIS